MILRSVFTHLSERRRILAERCRPLVESLNRFWDALSMGAKLSAIMAALIMAMTTFFYAFSVYQTTREIKIGAIHKGEAVAEALKDEVAYGLQAGNFPALNFTFRRLTSTRHNIAYVFLLDAKGQVLSHSEPEHVGRVLSDRSSQESLSAPHTRVHFSRVDLEGDGHLSDLCNVSVPILQRGKRVATLHIGVSLTRYLAANAPRIRSTVALFVLPFSFFSILIAIKLSRSFTRPLKHLAHAATEISQGNYGVQLPLDRRDELGEVAQAFNTMAANLKENFSKVSDMANHDGLTGLYNARFFQEALARELEHVKRTSRPFSILIFDGDRFKRINDRYGHPVGDQILQHISRVSRSVLRGYDVLARYGGEEFIAMLPDATGSQALLLGERLRKMVEQRPFVTEEGDVMRVTVSVGVAQARAPYDRKELISQADQALYRAKENGRNRVVLFKPLGMERPLASSTAPTQIPS
jgi:diguanylate cyclase (GGDEF)-like protein